MNEAAKYLMVALGVSALAWLFIFPAWRPVENQLVINDLIQTGDSISFDMTYGVPWKNSCFVVVYGPFVFDRPGHEEGNNIYVLTSRTGTLKDTLALQEGTSLSVFKAELWCDNDMLAEVERAL
ncbi:MAG TPA: hypothetical protein ENN60_03470 [archaeon]|nr:hypothetical protein [archaeon]